CPGGPPRGRPPASRGSAPPSRSLSRSVLPHIVLNLHRRAAVTAAPLIRSVRDAIYRTSRARCPVTAIEAGRALRERRRAPGAGRTAGRSGRTRPHMSGPARNATPSTRDVYRSPAASMLLGPRALLLISALVLTVLEFQLDASLLSPALPQMAASLGVSIAEISNVRSAFFLAASVLGM